MNLKDIQLKSDERVLLVVHRYGLTLFWNWFIGAAFISLAFFFMFWLFGKGSWGQATFMLLIVFGILILFKTYYSWKKNAVVITTHRIIDIAQPRAFEREITDVVYDQIENVSAKSTGFFPTLFKYGTVLTQTGNGKVVIEVSHIKRPLQLSQMINELRERYMTKHAQDFSGNLLATMLDKLYELEIDELTKIRRAIDTRLEKLEKRAKSS